MKKKNLFDPEVVDLTRYVLRQDRQIQKICVHIKNILKGKEQIKQVTATGATVNEMCEAHMHTQNNSTDSGKRTNMVLCRGYIVQELHRDSACGICWEKTGALIQR